MDRRKSSSWVIWIIIGVILIWVWRSNLFGPVSYLAATLNDSRSVYAGPSVNYGVIGQIDKGRKIVVEGRNGDYWVALDYYGEMGWIQTGYLDVEGKVSRLPEIDYVPRPTPTIVISKEPAVFRFLNGLIDDPRYDPGTDVLHKYIDAITVKVDNSILTYTILGDIDDPDDFVLLGGDLVLAGILVSHAGEQADWDLEKIEVNWTGPQNSYAKLYVSGRKNLAAISSGQRDLFDLLETEVSYGDAESYSPKNDPVTVTCSCSYNAYNCSDFYSQAEAQACFESCYPVSGDIHWLDDDGDGRACELLP